MANYKKNEKEQIMGFLNSAVEFQRQRWLEEEETTTNSHNPPVDYRFNPNGFSIIRDLIAYFDKRMNKTLSGELEDETRESLQDRSEPKQHSCYFYALRDGVRRS